MTNEDARTRILDAALELFSNQGFSSTTTRSIAESAGVNELTIFRHFGTKERLLSEVIDHHFDEVKMNASHLDEPTGDPTEDLIRMINWVRMNLREREKLFGLLLREVSTNEIVSLKLGQFPVVMKGFMLRRFEKALGDRIRKDLNIETAGVFLASYFIRSEMMRIMIGEDPFHEIDEDRTREAIDIFLHGVAEGDPA
ncbi:MAG: TetR/AcrR family transcriptional regulator [Thermoplasmatota archaeon]